MIRHAVETHTLPHEVFKELRRPIRNTVDGYGYAGIAASLRCFNR